jgi:succinoglycan biosynthesis protein ExoM
VHCPAANISLARNACLDASSGADYLAFVDDDETVSREWLCELVATARETGADAVFGPVNANYALTAPSWLAEGDFHSTMPVFVEGEIKTGYTCNVLVKCKGLAAGLRFNLKRGKTGGEDTEFFARLHGLGGELAFSPRAHVFEDVTRDREALSWLLVRRYRAGQSHGAITLETQDTSRFALAGLAAAKAAYCAAAALLTVWSPVRSRANLLRGVLHAGVVSSALGSSELALYGRPAAADGSRES